MAETAHAWIAELARPDVRERPAPGVWSPIEYACHVRDVHAVFARRVARMIAEDDPQFENWDQDAAALEGVVRAGMEEAGFEVEYAAAVDGQTMRPIDRLEGAVLLAAAGRLGGTRLIDNVAMRVDEEGAQVILLEFPEWSRYHESG